MGILEELGLTEDDLDPAACPPSVIGESIPEEETREEEKLSTPTSLVESAPDDFFRKLREGEFDSPAHPMHPTYPDESGTESVIDEIVQAAQEESTSKPVSGEVPAKKKPKGKRVAYSVACTLSLSGSDYQVQLLPESSDYDKAYRLNKLNAQKPTGYNIMQIDGEIICECSDFRFRQDGSDSKGCKHIRGLVDMGMFASPSVSHRQGSGVFG